jgi:hypothetical protein
MLLFVSCKDKTVIDEEEFAKLYYNVLLTQEKFNSDSTLLKKEQDKVFQKFGITEKQYYSTLATYNKDPERWRNFFEYLKSYTDTLQKKPMRR